LKQATSIIPAQVEPPLWKSCSPVLDQIWDLTLSQWFPNFAAHGNHLGALKKKS
jgi:hypothetical protein